MRSFSPKDAWSCLLTILCSLTPTANAKHDLSSSPEIARAGAVVNDAPPASYDDEGQYEAYVELYGKAAADELKNVLKLARMDKESFRKAIEELLHGRMWPAGVQQRSDVCTDCPAGWAGYKNCSEKAKEAEESYRKVKNMVDNTVKEAVSLLGLADIPLTCGDCGSAATAAAADAIDLARTMEDFFSLNCIPETREAKWKLQEALAKANETTRRDDITNDMKKIDVLLNSLDNVTTLMIDEFQRTKKLLDNSTEAIVDALNTQQDKEIFVSLYYSYKTDIRFKLQDTFEKVLDYRNIEEHTDSIIEMQNLMMYCSEHEVPRIITNMSNFFNSDIVFQNEAPTSDDSMFLPRVLDLVGDNLGSFSQFMLDIVNDIILAQIVLRECADVFMYSQHTGEIIRKDAEATIADVMVALSKAASHYQNIYLPRNGRFDRNEITILRNQVNGFFKGSKLNPAIENFLEERERNIVVFRTAIVHMPCPSKDACNWEVIWRSKQWLRVVEDRAAYLNDSVQYVAIMDSTRQNGNDDGTVPVFAAFARPSFVNTSHTKNVDEAVKRCYKNLSQELENVFYDHYPLIGDYDPKLKNIVGLKGFLEVGHRIMNFTVEKSDGYLKITAGKEKKNIYNCPDDYPVRPLAVLYGVTDSEKKWYAGESRHFYPEPFESQVVVHNTEGDEVLVDAFFYAIVFY